MMPFGLCNTPVPCSLTDVLSFQGFCNYHRRFVKDHASIYEPLQWVTRTGKHFQWDIEQKAAFDTLKELMVGSPMLHHQSL